LKDADERFAAAIQKQLALPYGPTPVIAIAEAVDIVEIRRERLTSFEAALVAEPERGEGWILVNAAASQQRQLFSIAHELGHFLNPWHRPIESSDLFACHLEDLRLPWRRRPRETSRHIAQDAKANRFAIELLAPEKFLRPYLGGLPDLAKAVRLARELNLSREAAARRYA
jgi:Zn-dependent peptidase ImmA (M78 family)